MLTYTTAGESHGPALVAVLEGLPCGVKLDKKYIDTELARRQKGVGRGKRMEIEQDQIEILSGVRFGESLGTPLAMLIRNKDFKNWKRSMSVEELSDKPPILTEPRPGHADLAGVLKTGQRDIRNVLERASARETAAKVAVGAIVKTLLKELSITVFSHVTRIGQVESELPSPGLKEIERIEASPVRCADEKISQLMVEEIEKAKAEKDSLGGTFEVLACGMPPGLGSYISWDRKLDGAIAKALMSIPAIKGVELGAGFELAASRGSQAHDEIFFEKERGFYHKTNRAGGIEGGMTNGEPIIVRAVMKPIPTVGKPLRTVDIQTKQQASAFKERADICAVPSASVIAEAALAIELAKEVVTKFGGDSLDDLKASYFYYLERIKNM